MSTLNNKLINSVINLGIAESNTQLANTDKKIKVNNILDFMPQETATILRENKDFLKKNGIDITNPKDMIMCTVQVIFSQFDLLSKQISDVQNSLLGDRIAEIQTAQNYYKTYEIAHKNNNKIIIDLKELISTEEKIIQAIKDNKFSTIEKKYHDNLENEKRYLQQVEENTNSGINKLQNSFLNDIDIILKMPDKKIAIKSTFPFICKFTGEKVSKVKDIDASNHRCKQTLDYIEQGYKLKLLVTMKLHEDNSSEYIENILEDFNNFLKNQVMSGNNLRKIHGYDDEPEKEFWLTEPQRMLEDINNFKDSSNIGKELATAIEENQEEFYEDEDYENITIM